MTPRITANTVTVFITLREMVRGTTRTGIPLLEFQPR